MESGAIAEERASEAPATPAARGNGRRNAVVGLCLYVVATIVLISFTGVLLARETIFLWLLWACSRCRWPTSAASPAA